MIWRMGLWLMYLNRRQEMKFVEKLKAPIVILKRKKSYLLRLMFVVIFGLINI